MNRTSCRLLSRFYLISRRSLVEPKIAISVSKFGMSTEPEKELTDELRKTRVAYHDKSRLFLETSLRDDPMVQFKEWLAEAKEHPGIREANAFCLATCGADGYPSARVLLLKGFDNAGFTFFTNYESQKARDMADNDKVCMNFYWEPLVRQVRIQGRVSKIPDEESEEYFLSRPLGSRVGAWASSQSTIIPSRQFLDDRVKQFEDQFGENVPKPPHWGGYLLVPETVEFWQGQSNRVHDRIRFRKVKDDVKADGVLVHAAAAGWVYERLAP